MKKVLPIILILAALLTFAACGSSHADEEAAAKSVLSSAQAVNSHSPDKEKVTVTIKKVEFIKEQTAHDNYYSYFIVETKSHDWGYAELRNGTVRTFNVGYSQSEAKTRCKDLAVYRLSDMGGLGQ